MTTKSTKCSLFQNLREHTVNIKDLRALTLVGPTPNNPKLDPLAVLHHDNQLCIFNFNFSGERIAIQGFDPSKGPNLSNFQFQVKPQTLQFQMDPTKLTVLQELPEVGKVYFLDHFEWMLKGSYFLGPTFIGNKM